MPDPIDVLDLISGPPASPPRPGWTCRWPHPRYCVTGPASPRPDEDDSAEAWAAAGSPWHAAAAIRRGQRAQARVRSLTRELDATREEAASLAAELHAREGECPDV